MFNGKNELHFQLLFFQTIAHCFVLQTFFPLLLTFKLLLPLATKQFEHNSVA